MPGAMRKLGLYLGLVEDDEDRYDPHGYAHDEDYDDVEPEPRSRGREPQRESVRSTVHDTGVVRRTAEVHQNRGSVALEPAVRAVPAPAAFEDPYRITTLHPRTYNEARTIGEHFRDGTPVIMNLTEMDDTDAKRLVDFAAGLSFGLRGRIERVTNKVFLLSPEHVEVTAADKARIAENGFFNQS